MKERNNIGSELRQKRHRIINTVIGSTVLCVVLVLATITSSHFAEVEQEQKVIKLEQKRIDEILIAHQIEVREIAQLVKDEGYRKCVYKDSLGLRTIGFGHLMLEHEKFTCITGDKAVAILRADYNRAEASVDLNYHWAFGEVRLVLINMTYQMGTSGVKKFKHTLEHLRDESFDEAASELLDSKWAGQTPHRASRLAGRIMGLHE